MKVLLYTPSYKRPYMLRQCMHDIKNQSYTDFTYSISIKYDKESEVSNYDILFDDILDERFIIHYMKDSTHHTNALSAIQHCPEPYDLYIKIDDDDIHKKDYVKTIVNYFQMHECDIISSEIHYQLNNYYFSTGKFRSLGGHFPNNTFLMPQTFAFNHKALQVLYTVADNGQPDDLLWRDAWSRHGLKDANVDNSKNIIWHIHGKNATVGNWFVPN
ncbi:glycosyltransferase [Neobacillus niacini]|uniref:glycosyltransferase n=1 Tax=Neobacillus niacini TaxID=86668 RepID=UPI0021CB3E55|nr:glycosyltransferase [Neobacillus niacini]MCM3765778.1 glycosyltransferase [Neobacillus niacini]